MLEEVSYLSISQRKSKETQNRVWKADCKNPTSKQNQPKCPLFCTARACFGFGFAFLCGGGGAQVWSLRDGQNRGENVRGGVEEALNQADPTRSCERGGKLAAGLIILISFTLWITVEL